MQSDQSDIKVSIDYTELSQGITKAITDSIIGEHPNAAIAEAVEKQLKGCLICERTADYVARRGETGRTWLGRFESHGVGAVLRFVLRSTVGSLLACAGGLCVVYWLLRL